MGNKKKASKTPDKTPERGGVSHEPTEDGAPLMLTTCDELAPSGGALLHWDSLRRLGAHLGDVLLATSGGGAEGGAEVLLTAWASVRVPPGRVGLAVETRAALSVGVRDAIRLSVAHAGTMEEATLVDLAPTDPASADLLETTGMHARVPLAWLGAQAVGWPVGAPCTLALRLHGRPIQLRAVRVLPEHPVPPSCEEICSVPSPSPTPLSPSPPTLPPLPPQPAASASPRVSVARIGPQTKFALVAEEVESTRGRMAARPTLAIMMATPMTAASAATATPTTAASAATATPTAAAAPYRRSSYGGSGGDDDSMHDGAGGDGANDPPSTAAAAGGDGVESVAGMHTVRGKIWDALELSLRHRHLFDSSGITPPTGVLLHGPPGTGKTLLARSVCAQLGVPLISIR